MALCQSGCRCLSVSVDHHILTDIPDAYLPRIDVCNSDFPDLYVNHDLCEPFGYFKVAYHE
jgi:hypothetical protein